MKRLKFLKRRYIVYSTIVLLVAVLGIGANINVDVDNPFGSDKSPIGNFVTITIGTEQVYAAGTPDYTCDGVDDDVQFQAALNALPATGGEIEVLGGTYVNANLTSITRAINNVTVTGVGFGTSFTGDGVTPTWICGGNNWKFQDLQVDTGGLTVGVTTDWQMINVKIGATTYAYYDEYINIVGNTLTTTAITTGGKLTAGANEIEGSNFDINGGNIDGTVLGASAQVTVTDADINGGTINDTDITIDAGDTLNTTGGNLTTGATQDVGYSKKRGVAYFFGDGFALAPSAEDTANWIWLSANDGDDDTDINTAINTVAAAGGSDVVILGDISCDDPWDAGGNDNVRIRGAGREATTVTMTDTSESIIDINVATNFLEISDMTLKYSSYSSANAIDWDISANDTSHHWKCSMRNLNVEYIGSSYYAYFFTNFTAGYIENCGWNHGGGAFKFITETDQDFNTGDTVIIGGIGQVDNPNSVSTICFEGDSGVARGGADDNLVNIIHWYGAPQIFFTGAGTLAAGNSALELEYTSRISIDGLWIEGQAGATSMIDVDTYSANSQINNLGIYMASGSATITLEDSNQMEFNNCNFGGATITGGGQSYDFNACTNYTLVGFGTIDGAYFDGSDARAEVAAIAGVIGADNIVGYWEMVEVSGTTIADYGPNEHDFTADADISANGWEIQQSDGEARYLMYDASSGRDLVISDHADFTFGDGNIDSAHAIFVAGRHETDPTEIQALIGKGSEWGLRISTSDYPYMILFDTGGVNTISGENQVAIGDGEDYVIGYSLTPSDPTVIGDVTLYKNKDSVAINDISAGAYDAMGDKATDIYSGRVSSGVYKVDGGISRILILGTDTTDDEAFIIMGIMEGANGD